MTNEQINIAIAESLGWTNCRLAIKGAGGGARYLTAHGIPPNRKYEASCPNYTADLNAMHQAEIAMFKSDGLLWHKYASCLDEDYVNQPYTIGATARQRAEAYLRTIGKWKETK